MYGRLARFGAFPSFDPLTPRLRIIPRLDLLRDLVLMLALLLLALALFSSPVRAQATSTIFLTERNAGIAFPFLPPNRATGGPARIDNTTIGSTTPQPGTFTTLTAAKIVNNNATPVTQGTPNAQTVSATLTAANLQAGIITVSQGAGAGSTLTLPLGTAMDTAFPSAIVNSAFDFSIANISVTSGETATVAAAAGFTIVGQATMAITTSGRFRARKTGTGTWVLYRLS